MSPILRVVIGIICFVAAAVPALATSTERVSIDSAGNQANDQSFTAAISGDGRFVAFASGADNLAAGDTNNATDVFVYDRQTGTTERVSVDSSGVQGNGSSSHASINADGRFVTFHSHATNLVVGDVNNTEDIFVHDRLSHVTERVSVNSSGGGGGFSTGWGPTSADGRIVAFLSRAADLVPGDTNGAWDVFVRDRQDGITSRVSVHSSGAEANGHSDSIALSADGRIVAFSSRASNLVAGDQNGAPDVFVHDRQTGITTRVNLDPSGNEVTSFNVGSPVSLGGDGRLIAFSSFASTLVAGDSNGSGEDVFVHDLQTGITSLESVDSFGNQSNYSIGYFALSGDGRFVTFQSASEVFVAGDTNNSSDVFRHDRQTGVTERMSVDSSGNEANGDSFGPLAISADGGAVVFESPATNLVENDNNDLTDVFVHVEEIAADADGVPDAVEDAAPNGGDGNADGISDSEQANVTSVPNPVDEQFVTLVSPAGTTLAAVETIDPETLPPPPVGLESLPVGVVSFDVAGVAPGAAVEVELLLPAGTAISSYYKYGAEPGDPTDHWYEFLDDGTTGAVLGTDRVTLRLVDGGRGDADLALNGRIVDPGAPVLSQVAYGFTGFFQPVDNPPVVNQLKAGSAVPVKFTLNGNFGLAILEDGYPRSQAVACASGAPLDAIELSTAAGRSGLTYDPVTAQYTYTWKTEKAWSGTCRRFELKLNDGSAPHFADFKFSR